MRRLYLALSLALLALGVLHTVVALRRLWPLAASGVWFLAGGTAILLTAALNLLNRAYGRAAHGIRATTAAANLVMFVSSVLGGIATHAKPVQLVLVLTVTGGLFVLSLFEASLMRSAESSRP